MVLPNHNVTTVALSVLAVWAAARPLPAENVMPIIFPGQRQIEVRDPAAMPRVRLPDVPPPPTVDDPKGGPPIQHMTLDEAIRIALENSEVIRVLGGVGAASTGRTIYDPAIASMAIAQQKARFDPTVTVDNSFNRFDQPSLLSDPANPLVPRIGGGRSEDYNMQLSVEKPTTSGGVLGFRANTNPTRFHPGVLVPANPLNPQTRSNAEFSFRQPLLQGAGFRPNLAPIVVARIDTERSFFQLKDSLQEMVRSVIEGYWALVSARTDQWARTQQVEQATFAYQLAEARLKTGLGSLAEVAQAKLALANFRVGLIAAQANVLQREAALLNVLGMPPSAPIRPVPVTPMSTDKIDFDWNGILELAAQQRPDLIELKLILEADQQQLLMARNQALPRVDAVMLYRWNGLEGRLPNGATIASDPGQFADWTLGVNFSVPLGLRQSRAALRQQDLVVARDRANIEQGLHQTTHQLAATIRTLAQDYAQFEALTETRDAARENLRVQAAQWRANRIIFLNVLQAIANWGDTTSSQAQTLAQYNSDLASMERQTGTILESHGIRLFEERFASIGPLGRVLPDRCYPGAIGPGPNAAVYPGGSKPSEEALDLKAPVVRRGTANPRQREIIPIPASPRLPAPPQRTPPIDLGPEVPGGLIEQQ